MPHVIAVTDALAYAHGQNVIHRDIKPSNVLVGAFGETVVIDWGLAKLIDADDEMGAPQDDGVDLNRADLTVEGRVLGTPNYMPPEQARGEPINTTADVYSIGACLYHVLSGAPPYQGTSRDSVVSLLKGPPADLRKIVPEAPSDLVAIVNKSMARSPSERYTTAKEMAEDLRRFAEGRRVSVHVYTARQLVSRWLLRNRGIAILGLLSFVIVVMLTSFSFRQIRGERDHAELARRQATEEKSAAIAQRRAAETLIVALLGDLRDKLIETGRLDVLSSLANRIIDYYGVVPPPSSEDDDGAALAQRATALTTIAGIDEVQGKTEQAELRYIEADRLYTEALKIRDNNEFLSKQAWARYRLGLAGYHAMTFASAIGNYDTAIGELLRVKPADDKRASGLRATIALVQASKAQSLAEMGQLNEAASLLSKLVGELQAQPDDDGPKRVSASLGWALMYRSKVSRLSGDFSAAMADAERAIEIRRRAAKSAPEDRYAVLEIANAAQFYAEALRADGDQAGALRTASEAILYLDDLLRVDSSQKQFRGAKGLHMINRSRIDRSVGRLDEALCDAADGKTLLESASAYTTDGVASVELADALFELGEVQHARKHLQEALGWFDAALKEARRDGRSSRTSVEHGILIPRIALRIAQVREELRFPDSGLDGIAEACREGESAAEHFVNVLPIETTAIEAELAAGKALHRAGARADGEALVDKARQRCARLRSQLRGGPDLTMLCALAGAR